MPIVQVQTATGATTSNQAAVTATLASTPTAGNTLIAVHHTRKNVGVPPSGWTAGPVQNSTDGGRLQVYYKATSSGTASALSATAVAACNQSLILMEWSGVATPPFTSNAGHLTSQLVNSVEFVPGDFSMTASVHLAIVGTEGKVNWLRTWRDGFASIAQATSVPNTNSGGSSLQVATYTGTATSGTAESWGIAARASWMGLTLAPAPAVPGNTPKFSGTVAVPGIEVPAGETWAFDPDVSTTVTATGNVIVRGTLQMKPASASVVHTLILSGVEANYVGGGMVPIDSDVGLWIVDEGLLDAVGTTRTPWVRTTTSLAAGATTATLASSPTGWEVGDTIVICPTEPTTTASNWATFDETTISTISGTTLTFPATTYAHPTVAPGDGTTYGAEILNLTRNVIIQGVDATRRSHIFCRNQPLEPTNDAIPQTVSYVALRYMGPRQGASFVLGRYAWHIHHSESFSYGSVFTGVVARDIGSHVFVTHGSDGVTWDRCIAYNFNEDAFWWDIKTSTGDPDVPTNDTSYLACVAAKGVIASGSSLRNLNGFNLGRGKGNECSDSVATGVQGLSNASGFEWPEGVADAQWIMEDCMSHNNKQHGVFVWQNQTNNHVVTRLVSFHNGAFGLNHGAYGNGYHYVSCVFYANGSGPMKLAANSRPDVPQYPVGNGQIKWTSCIFDGNDLAGVKYAVVEGHHSRAADQPVLFTTCTFKRVTGTNAAGMGLTGSNSLNAAWWKVASGNTFTAINKYYFANTTHSGTYVEDVATTTSYQRSDKAGTLDATANARTNNPAATRTAT